MNDFLKKTFKEYSISYFGTIITTFMLSIFSPVIIYIPYLIVKTIFFCVINRINNLEEINANYDASWAIMGLIIYVLLIKLLTLKISYLLYFKKNLYIILFNILIYFSFYFIFKTNIKLDCCFILSLFQSCMEICLNNTLNEEIKKKYLDTININKYQLIQL